MRDFEAAKILFVTDSGAGAPFVKLYLMPKSWVGPDRFTLDNAHLRRNGRRGRHTTGVVTGGEQDTTGCLSFPDDVTGSRCAQYAILSDQEFLDSICGTNLGDQLHHFGVVVSSISTYDQEATLCALGYREKDAGDKRLAVVGLLEDGNLLSEPRPIEVSAWGDELMLTRKMVDNLEVVEGDLRSWLLVSVGLQRDGGDAHCRLRQ